MRRRGTTAILMTAVALAASSPEASVAAEKLPASANICRTANHNKSNRFLRKIARQIGSKIINFNPDKVKGDNPDIQEASSINGGGARTVTIDSGQSSVAGSNGKYTLEVSAVDIGNNDRLDISDVNRVKVSLGSAPDGGPLFGLTVNHLQKKWTDGPRDNNCWWGVNGTAIMPSGQRVSFNGTTDTRYAPQPEIFLDGQETVATGTVMKGILSDALSSQPTHLVDSPIKELQ